MQEDTGELTLADREEIRGLGLEYADAWLTRDAEKMLSLWLDRPQRVTEPDGVDIFLYREVVANWEELGTTILQLTNHLIWPDGDDRATGRVYCLAQMDRPEGLVDQTIVYQDWYVRVDGRWLFDRRRHFLWFGSARESNPLDQAPAEWTSRGANQVGAGRLPHELAAMGLTEPNERLR